MILQALTKLYEDLAKQGRIARPGWSKTKISYALCINDKGELEQIIPLLDDSEAKKLKPRQFDLPAPIKRSSGIGSNFLWDNSSYLLGTDNKDRAERCKQCFDAAKELHHDILDGVNSPAAQSILNFFDSWDPGKANQYLSAMPNFEAAVAGANLLFRINGSFAQDDVQIQEAWQRHYDQSGDEKHQCLITGSDDEIAAVHPAIKGVDGAQSSGAALVSFNAPAFCSYGQEQNYNAPIGRYAAFAYTSALNYLLADREKVQKIGDTTIVCWADGAEPQYQAFTFSALFGGQDANIDENDLRNCMRRLATGLPVPERKLDPNCVFYILGLAPNAARISVRFFYRNSFGGLMKNVNAHYNRMEIVMPKNDRYTYLPIWAILQETIRKEKKSNQRSNSEDSEQSKSNNNVPSPLMAGATARAIFTGGLYPAALLEQIMMRIRAERKINRGKAAIIKAYYLRNQNPDCPKEVLTVALNEASTNPAYTLGRLFSVYESIQEAANPGINTTIKDKYFNSAASTPATIFPLLNNLCQKHLRKLSTGNRVWYEKQIMSLTGILGDTYPARLNLPQQGSFDLGYYHQTQKRYEKKEEK